MKTCSRCGVEKPLSEFYQKSDGKWLSWCRQCYSEAAAERYAADPERHRAISSEWAKANRPAINEKRRERRSDPAYRERELERDRKRQPDRWIKEHYGLSREQWNAILQSQGGGCAICGTQDPGGGGVFHVDHDHSCCPTTKTCGKCVRGLLCNRCNPMIGHAMDDPVILRNAAAYLEVARPGGVMQ